MPTEIYLIRHGIPENRQALLGQSDPHLTQQGRDQAGELAGRLANVGIERVLSSALRRSVETARTIAAALRLELEIDPRLNEISYGSWEGLPWEEIERRDPDTARAKLGDWWGVTPKGGEPFADFCRRVREAFSELARTPHITALVGHVGVNAVLAELARQARSGDDSGEIHWDRIRGFDQEFGTFERVEIA